MNNTQKMAAMGLVLVVVLLGGGYFLFKGQQAPVVPITALKCSSAYFNYVVGKPEVIVSAKGEDTAETKTVSCQYSYTDPNGTPSASTINGVLADMPGGKSWNCTDRDKLFPKGSTKFNVTVTDDHGGSSTCANTIYLP